MKKLLFILVLFSCSDHETDQGCFTAIPKNGTERMFIKCCTRQEFASGEHETPSWSAYKSHQWEKCSNCQ